MTTTLIRGGRVFDGTGAPIRSAEVLVCDGVIERVGPSLGLADEVIDAAGGLVLPGLIDTHVHVTFNGMDSNRIQAQPFSLQFYEAAANLRRILHSGVTTVRDAGGADLGIKSAVEQGLIEGPRMRIAISVLSQTGGHADGWNVHGDEVRLMVPHPGRPDCVVDGPDEMRKRVREVLRAGADTIKVCASGGVMSTRDDPRHPQFSAAELEVCVAEATDAGVPVMAHAHGAEGIKRALRAGVRSIEHGVYLDEEGIELLLAHDAWLVPTMLAPLALVDAIDAGMVVPPEVEAKARGIAETHQTAVARAHAAGVKIAMGTDSGVFAHGSSPRELALMMGAGLSLEDALYAATGSAADLLGLPDVGRLVPGHRADLVVLASADLGRFAEELRVVMAGGRVLGIGQEG